MAGRYTTTDTDYAMDEELVPFLPDDVGLQCLLRVPVQAHAQLQGVCRKWRDLINSSEFYEHRRKEGTTGHCICLLQAIPRGSSNSQPHPMFNVSLLTEKNSWERLPPIPGFHHPILPLFSRFTAVAGALLVLGGWDPSTMVELRSVYIFSFSSWTWSRGADMPSTRSFFTCATLEGCVVVAGGHDAAKNALRSADRYNLQQDRWESLPDMRIARDECASAVLDGKLYVISGYGTSSQGEFRRDGEVFDPDLNKWTHDENLWAVGSKAVSPSSVVATAGRLFAFHHRQLICYSPKENYWQGVDCIPEGPTGVSSAVCATGFGNSLVVTGPWNCDGASHRTLVYRLPGSMGSGSGARGKGRWEMVPVDEHFLGLSHVSCVVEV